MASSDPKYSAVTALRRFGVGARSGDVDRIQADPLGFVMAQLGKNQTPPSLNELDSSPSIVQRARAFLDTQRKRNNADQSSVPDMSASTPAPPTQTESESNATKSDAQFAILLKEIEARTLAANNADGGLCERLVWFWSNHFCVSTRKGFPVAPLAGAFEREAIRPHVLGHFRDMLRAVSQHPAMLVFLDNQLSIGPNSLAGQKRGRGLNENLAREILELHTLGVNGGYTQQDVTSFAKALTGWSMFNVGSPQFGNFTFHDNWHEPGAQSILGKTYEQTGADQGEAVLDDLARHPSTARFIARKLARHFVADEPPKSLVERLASVFRETDGNLREVTRELIASSEAWSAPATKMRTPYEFIVAANRAMDVPHVNGANVLTESAKMGQRIWQPSGPNGYPDTQDALLTPTALKARLDYSRVIGRRHSAPSPLPVMQDLYGAELSKESRTAISQAATADQGFALLLMTPEFLRR